MNIAVTNAAELHVNENVVWSNVTSLELERPEVARSVRASQAGDVNSYVAVAAYENKRRSLAWSFRAVCARRAQIAVGAIRAHLHRCRWRELGRSWLRSEARKRAARKGAFGGKQDVWYFSGDADSTVRLAAYTTQQQRRTKFDATRTADRDLLYLSAACMYIRPSL
jgi:hypothetical protein